MSELTTSTKGIRFHLVRPGFGACDYNLSVGRRSRIGSAFQKHPS